jgi:hypothetical protein
MGKRVDGFDTLLAASSINVPKARQNILADINDNGWIGFMSEKTPQCPRRLEFLLFNGITARRRLARWNAFATAHIEDNGGLPHSCYKPITNRG